MDFVPSEIRLSTEQHEVMDRLTECRGQVFLTGKAGSGKSTLLQIIRNNKDFQSIVLAPTGVAAINVQGQTIHSFFKFPPGIIQRYNTGIQKLIKKADVIIIDEVSMVRADLCDHINLALQTNTKSKKAFGGKPIIFVGDLFQLPPVVSRLEEEFISSQYESPYFFSSRILKSLSDFELIELRDIFRQKDQSFIQLLNRIRKNECGEEDLFILNERLLRPANHEYDEWVIHLCGTNATAQGINLKKLSELPGVPKTYPAKVTGKVNINQFPIDQMLTLKSGAQIVFLRNDPDKRFVNGSLGKVIECKQESLLVSIEGHQEPLEINAVLWDQIEYHVDSQGKINQNIIGNISQFPIKAAWAITIHKSQGKTFEKVHIDLGSGAFENGQLYVALSRCKTLEGIRLRHPIRYRDIRTDDRIVDFMNQFR